MLNIDMREIIISHQIELTLLSKRYKAINVESVERVTNATLNMDDEYTELEFKQQALKSGLAEIQMSIEFCKSDLRILNSVFYNKF